MMRITRLKLVRVWLPLVVTTIGTAMMVYGLLGDDLPWAEGGAFVVSAGLSIWLLNVLHRMGVSGDRARDEEDEARAFFDRHGRWPDDPEPPRPPEPPARSGGAAGRPGTGAPGAGPHAPRSRGRGPGGARR